MKIAVFADTHLNSAPGTPQVEVLKWALDTFEQSDAACAVFAGDITACGDIESCILVDKLLKNCKKEVFVVPGNSELRTPETECVAERLFAPVPGGVLVGDVRVLGINTSTDKILPAERKRLEKVGAENLVLYSHQDYWYLDADSKEFISAWLRERQKKGQKILYWFSGHSHGRRERDIEGVKCLTVRALDPDKCIGGPPEMVMFDTDTLEIESVEYTKDLFFNWSEAERKEFADSLGITLYKLKEDLRFAIDNGVKHLELRSVYDPDEETLNLIDTWRKTCGKTLSMHLSEMRWDAENEQVVALAHYDEIIETAVKLKTEFATVHPPYESCETMSTRGIAFDALADVMAEKLRPLYENGVTIVVENNHTKTGDSRKCEERKFGCGPMELYAWRNALNARLGKDACRLRFDIGHARNNIPVSQFCPLGSWYALGGQDFYTYHMHQTKMYPGSVMKNHFEIDGLDTGLVCFHGFMLAWRTGVLRHGPIILEIREDHKAPETYLYLRNLLMNGGK